MVTLHFITARKLLKTGTTLLQRFRIASKLGAKLMIVKRRGAGLPTNRRSELEEGLKTRFEG